MIKKMADEDALPTQLYLSTNAADSESFIKINRPKYKDSWERWNKTLGMLKDLDTRTVLRLTIIRDHNNDQASINEFTKMIDRSQVHFVEIKSYMHIGYSTNRLERDHMLEAGEIRDISRRMVEKSNSFGVMDESEISRIIVLENQKRGIDRFIAAYAQTS